MRGFIAILAAALLMAPPVRATEATPLPPATQTGPLQPGPLQPGRSAGVRQAQQAHAGLALVGGSAIIALVVVVAGTSGGGSNGPANPQFAPTTTTP